MIAWLKMMSRRRYYWAADACSCCGARLRFDFPVIWDRLAQDWEITEDERKRLDLRDSSTCFSCRANGRARGIASVLLEDIAETFGISSATIRKMADALEESGGGPEIAEINALPGLHPYLVKLPCVTYSEYGSENSEDLLALSYAGDTFDYILTSDTLEHIPDFDLAFSELRRVLKPGGKHIFSIPVLWNRQTRQRASVVDGKVIHHFPPSYHGSPGVDVDDYLVFNEFGGDVIERIEQGGFKVSVHRFDQNELLATIKAQKL